MFETNPLAGLSGKHWETTFTSNDVQKAIDLVGPVEFVYYSAEFNLAWFVSQIFRNQKGKPLRLEAFQQVMLHMLWFKKFPLILATRGAGKTFMLAVYAALKAILSPGSKIVIVGAGFRQAKLVFKYIEQLYNASPIFQEAVGQAERPKYGSDAATLQVGLSQITAIPIGDGEKIRGLRATILIADEFASIPEEIFDIVIKPFTAVHADPAERAANKRFMRRLEKLDANPGIVRMIEELQGFGNQVVISGTPSYRHNHFYHRYCFYRAFINSKGDTRKLKIALEEQQLARTGQHHEVTEEDLANAERMWHQYTVYQLPYTALPEDFMDEDMIRSDRAQFPKTRFAMEYLSQFPEDSDGFIKRSWIERGTPRDPQEKGVWPELYGNPRETYVMGLDPARWNDNFGCVVFKLTERGKELVFCTAWDKTQYGKSATRIREIVKRFNISYICMDTGGGGESVREWLCKSTDADGNKVRPEDLIWVIPDQIKKYADMTDMAAPGRKILEMVDFTTAWISKAAHDVAASIEQRNILFPHRAEEIYAYDQYMRHFDKHDVTESEKEALQADLWGVDDWDAERMTKKYKTKIVPRIGMMQHIEECVNETCAIVRNVSPKGTESFELPKLSEQPEGLDMRRRDRWSALMLANFAAKTYMGSGHGHTHRTHDAIGKHVRRGGASGYVGGGTGRRGNVLYPSFGRHR